MDDFINVIKKNSQVRIEIKIFLDKHNKLSSNYQSIKGYDTLIQKVVLEQILNLMSFIMVDVDIDIKMKVSRKKLFESKLLCQHNY